MKDDVLENNSRFKENTLNDEKSDTEETKEPFCVFKTKEEWQTEINRILSGKQKDYKKLKDEMAKKDEIIKALKCYIEKAQGVSENIADNWFNEIMGLKDEYPDTDVTGLLENEKFISLLTKGNTAKDAFLIINHDNLIDVAKQNEKEVLLSNIRAKALRPLEVGLNPRNGIAVKPNPSKFSKKELERLVERVMRGEKVVL